ncbi:D-alanyl-D-alanine carboxypeptidase/D-alanyl-D-alanine endopeptidase [Phytomonospora endophytica]|uniref:D-alanyl-D-alanine carboxypeptidase/D-alanyl-D-alanine-endopeptidase (Penicillin-binding protein 4) n=1 Tax=Phytomonospora endophytica TaxID=714109 RepID=A0A841FPN7_9ACTN|nr:D-alanyl-D-alanine carboxypeptidase/D-alanyl-D-alanine-endopeptidase [Phytomonospora endophytica]MBB6037794.1 D-alanyl-D-alanine carboxypeptidase/D-alanyl-D-alanine-endopeptidase (penicillin-binding protein 4) [Phytomonospora endophytica]GIG67677.1 D-alanyl-D-alanine carboxypeptidase/D-alanyl-D-alanine-endopeptidase [Phytomonospora endophytica]
MTSAIPHNRRLLPVLGVVLTLVLSGCTESSQDGTLVFEAEPSVTAPVLPGPSGAEAPTPEGVAAALEPLLSDEGLRGTLGVAVHDAATGELLFGQNNTTTLTPGSTNKVAVAAAVLATRGPDYRIPTRVVAGSQPGQVVIIGAGDPTLSIDGEGYYPGAASLADLAEQVKKALGDQPVTSVVLDGGAFTGPGLAPGVDMADIAAGWGANTTALMTDGGRIDPSGSGTGGQRHDTATPRYKDPGHAAAEKFAELLGAPTFIETGIADPGATELGVVHSPPMRRLVEETVLSSDNVVSDMLIRQVALARGLPGSFEDGTVAVAAVFNDLGIPGEQIAMVDGSGLSYDNRISAGVLSSLFAKAAGPDHPELRPLFAALPVAGYTGTLDSRYGHEQTAAGAGVVRAKTGTLSKVTALAGSVMSADGRELTFALLLNDRGNAFEAAHGLDRLAAALATCGCR